MKRRKLLLGLLGAALAASLAPAVAMAATPAKPTIDQGCITLTQPVSGSSIKISWLKDTAATKYAVRYSRSSTMKGAKYKYVSSKYTSTTITGLKAGYNYYFQVRAYGKTTKTTPKYKWSTARHCSTAYKGKVNSYSWKQLKSISNKIAACTSKSQALSVARKYSLIGASKRLSGFEYKNVKIYGVTFKAQIVDFWRDTRTTGKKAGITFMLKECPDCGELDKAGGSKWSTSSARTWCNNDLYKALPSDLRSYVCSVKKISWTPGLETETTYDKISIPSVPEVWGLATASSVASGWEDRQIMGEYQYKYFADVNVGVRAKTTRWFLEDLDDGNIQQWERSSIYTPVSMKLASAYYLTGSSCSWWTRDLSLLEDGFYAASRGGNMDFNNVVKSNTSSSIPPSYRPVFCI